MSVIPVWKACDTAQEFLDILRITSTKQNGRRSEWLHPRYWSSTWIFRGQESAEWDLIPTAWRTLSEDDEAKLNAVWLLHSTKEYFQGLDYIQWLKPTNRIVKFDIDLWATENNIDLDVYKPQNVRGLYLQILSEIYLKNRFINDADSRGHFVPAEAVRVSIPRVDILDYIVQAINLDKNNQIDKHQAVLYKIWADSSYALAQHHGIPTRLLDWTRNPLIAAFFAAEKVRLDPERKQQRLSVFAIDTLWLKDTFEVIDVPRHRSQFLHAQEGVFTFDIHADASYLKYGKFPNFDDGFWIGDGFPIEKLRKITLPHSEAGELLRLLHAEGISRDRLMPTYDNVTASIKTWRYWFNHQSTTPIISEEDMYDDTE